MCDKMAISAYILKIVEKDTLLRLQMRAKEMFDRHQFLFHKKAIRKDHKRADFWLRNFGYKRSLLSLLKTKASNQGH